MSRAYCSAAVLAAILALGACTSSQDVLEPSSITAPASGDASPPQATASDAPLSSSRADQTASVSKAVRIQFAPVVGATVDAATPLTERLAQQARARGIVLARNDDPGTTHVLKGYFSALTENGSTTVIYVWDIYDLAGTRLHRITGQQSAPAGSAEGWQSVSAQTMQAIADQTVAAFADWVGRGAG